jgi:cytochrome c
MQRPDTLLLHTSLPDGARNVLVAKCADCHSNATRWPVYSRVAPFSWLVERDIVEARRKLNLSDWSQLSADDQQIMLNKILHEARSGEMPPLQYRLVHWKAGLSGADLVALAPLAAGAEAGGASGAGNAVHGKELFEKRCTGCHALDADREGPRLSGVYGRRAGTVSGYSYSAGLKKTGIVWDELKLDHWLANPDDVAADNKMDFQVSKTQDRADLIAYLRQVR